MDAELEEDDLEDDLEHEMDNDEDIDEEEEEEDEDDDDDEDEFAGDSGEELELPQVGAGGPAPLAATCLPPGCPVRPA